jgi:hypothetical protein
LACCATSDGQGEEHFNPLKHVDPFGTILLPGVLLLLRSPFIFTIDLIRDAQSRARRDPIGQDRLP